MSAVAPAFTVNVPPASCSVPAPLIDFGSVPPPVRSSTVPVSSTTGPMPGSCASVSAKVPPLNCNWPPPLIVPVGAPPPVISIVSPATKPLVVPAKPRATPSTNHFDPGSKTMDVKCRNCEPMPVTVPADVAEASSSVLLPLLLPMTNPEK